MTADAARLTFARFQMLSMQTSMGTLVAVEAGGVEPSRRESMVAHVGEAVTFES